MGIMGQTEDCRSRHHDTTHRYEATLIGGALGALGATALSKPLAAAALTPSAAEGPFYPTRHAAPGCGQ